MPGGAVLRAGDLAQGPSKPTGRGLKRALNRRPRSPGWWRPSTSRLTCRAAGSSDLARHGMTARAQALRRHGTERRLATLVATVAYLEARSIDDCLELLDLLMMTELLGKAERAAGTSGTPAGTRSWPGTPRGWPPRSRCCSRSPTPAGS